jgi:hypothetical protein
MLLGLFAKLLGNLVAAVLLLWDLASGMFRQIRLAELLGKRSAEDIAWAVLVGVEW